MPDDTAEGGGRTDIIASVKSPISLITLFALIIDSVLVGSAVVTERMPMWLPLLVLVLIIVLFFITLWWKPESLYPPREEAKFFAGDVTLNFDKEYLPIELDEEACRLFIKHYEGGKSKPAPPNLKEKDPTWSLILPKDLGPKDTIRLLLVEHNGMRWRVPSFSPFEKTVKAKPIKTEQGGQP